jgi:multicomponent Na+:H+ antiporter subunit G
VSDTIAGVLLVLGAGFVLVGAVGVIRFDTPTERLHAAAKGPTLGLLLLGSGTAVAIGSTSATVAVVLIIMLQLLAGPLGSHMIGRAIVRDEPDDDPSARSPR